MKGGWRLPRWGTWGLLALGIVGVAVVILGAVLLGQGPGATSNGRTEDTPQRAATPGAPSASGATDSAGAIPPEEQLREGLDLFWNNLAHGGSDPAALGREYQVLRDLVHAADPTEAGAILIAELRRRRDARTGLPFRVGNDGVLSSAPTWRTALLDFLGQTDPWLALPFAREVLAETEQPDEYALALRNLGWVNVQNRLEPEIRTALENMLQRENWLNNPTSGYLEGFDLAVEIGGADMVRRMGDLLVPPAAGEQVDPVTFAAFLALDRMVQRHPEDFLTVLTAEPTWLHESPNYRAALLSRLDVRQPTQRAALENYLRDTRVSLEEKHTFLARFPQRSTVQGNRLVTSWEDVRQQRGLDPASLEQLSRWRQDPSLQHLHAEIAEAETRLHRALGR